MALGTLGSQSTARAALAAQDGMSDPHLLRRAVDAFDRHRGMIQHRDVIGIVDFSLVLNALRFHILERNNRAHRSHLVGEDYAGQHG